MTDPPRCGRSPDRATGPTEGLTGEGRPSVHGFGGVGRPAPSAAMRLFKREYRKPWVVEKVV